MRSLILSSVLFSFGLLLGPVASNADAQFRRTVVTQSPYYGGYPQANYYGGGYYTPQYSSYYNSYYGGGYYPQQQYYNYNSYYYPSQGYYYPSNRQYYVYPGIIYRY